MKLILGSGSPRRRDLLREAGYSFVVKVPGIDELRRPGEEASAYAKRNSSEKSAAVLSGFSESDICILCADTIVVVGDVVLEKPADDEAARQMLASLSGRSHDVITAVSLRTTSRHELFDVRTEVHFKDLCREEIDRYISSGEPFDKAGGYGIQGRAAFMVRRIVGSYTNVVGLPLAEVCESLKTLGFRGE